MITAAFTEDASQDLHSAFNVARLLNIQDAVAWKPTCAIIANPTSAHASAAVPLLKEGIPCLIEKPVCRTQEEFSSLMAAAHEGGTFAMAAFQTRRHPLVLELRRALASAGQVTSVQVVVGTHFPSWHPYEDYRELYAGRRDLGGGVVLTECHELDLLCSLFGAASDVAAQGGRASGLTLDVADTVEAVCRFRWRGEPFPCGIHLSFTEQAQRRTLSIVMENRRITLDLLRGILESTDSRATTVLARADDFDRNSLFKAVMHEFLAAVRKERQAETSLSSVKESHKLIFQLDSQVQGD